MTLMDVIKFFIKEHIIAPTHNSMSRSPSNTHILTDPHVYPTWAVITERCDQTNTFISNVNICCTQRELRLIFLVWGLLGNKAWEESSSVLVCVRLMRFVKNRVRVCGLKAHEGFIRKSWVMSQNMKHAYIYILYICTYTYTVHKATCCHGDIFTLHFLDHFWKESTISVCQI